MSATGNRAHPRYRIELAATVEIRQTGGGIRIGGDRTTRSSHSVSLRDVSAGGLCFVTKAGDTLDKGTPLTVKLVVAARTLSLPASVVWSKSGEGLVATGVRVHAEVTDSLTRSSYQRWLSQRAG